MGLQDLRPTVSSLKRPRFSHSDSDDAVTVLGHTVKRQRTHDSDDDLLIMEDSIRELDDLLQHEGGTSSTSEEYDCWVDDDDDLRSLIDEFDVLPDSAVAASAADKAAVVPQLTTHLPRRHHEIEEGPRTADEGEWDDEENLITEFLFASCWKHRKGRGPRSPFSLDLLAHHPEEEQDDEDLLSEFFIILQEFTETIFTSLH